MEAAPGVETPGYPGRPAGLGARAAIDPTLGRRGWGGRYHRPENGQRRLEQEQDRLRPARPGFDVSVIPGRGRG